MTAFALDFRRTDEKCLQAGQGLSLKNAAGVKVTPLTGHIWLTMEGDKRDLELPPGASYVIERDGLTLGYALEPTCVRFSSPLARREWWREWSERLWNGLVRIGEARAHSRMARGIYRQI